MNGSMRLRALSRVKSGLSDLERLVLVLYYGEKLKFAEIAEVLSISSGQAYLIYLHSLFKVRRLLKNV
ncbi:MAG: hypothetical protein NUW37_10560 [Planctomycetes bacterium]|nr:hypothetical protein [Planctomycetota bacterium]